MLLLFFGVSTSRAGFSTIYVFGDSVSSTSTNNATGQAVNYYYGPRYSNGRVWVELLAQRQGLGANSTTNLNWNYSSNNLSFYGHYSPVLVTNVNKFVAPANATNCLFVVWVCDADFVGDINDNNVGAINNAYHGTNLVAWTNAINQHLTNHFNIITNLYAKGCRTLIAPNSVDVTEVPEYNTAPAAYRAFVRQRTISFNTNYAAMLNHIAASSPGLTIYSPDVFRLLDDLLTNAASFGMTNALLDQGNGPLSIDAIDAYGYGMLPNVSLNGSGANYIFWDPISPSAKFQEAIADAAQQLLSPVAIGNVAVLGNSNQLNLVNLPVGLNGLLLTSTNLAPANWTTNLNFAATNTPQSLFFTTTNQQQFYRLKFPYQWTWP